MKNTFSQDERDRFRSTHWELRGANDEELGICKCGGEMPCEVVTMLDDADSLSRIIADAVDQLEFEGNDNADTIRKTLRILRGEDGDFSDEQRRDDVNRLESQLRAANATIEEMKLAMFDVHAIARKWC